MEKVQIKKGQLRVNELMKLAEQGRLFRTKPIAGTKLCLPDEPIREIVWNAGDQRILMGVYHADTVLELIGKGRVYMVKDDTCNLRALVTDKGEFKGWKIDFSKEIKAAVKEIAESVKKDIAELSVDNGQDMKVQIQFAECQGRLIMEGSEGQIHKEIMAMLKRGEQITVKKL